MFPCHGSWKLLGQSVQLPYKKLSWKLQLFIQASLIASGEREGQGCLEACLVIWDESPWGGCQAELKWEESHLLWRKVRRVSSLASPLCRPEYISQHLLTKYWATRSVSPVWQERFLEGASFLCPVFLQSWGVLKSTLSGGSRRGLCPYFIRIQILSAVLAELTSEQNLSWTSPK